MLEGLRSQNAELTQALEDTPKKKQSQGHIRNMNSQETSSESEVGPSINDIIKQHQKKDRVLICKTCMFCNMI